MSASPDPIATVLARMNAIAASLPAEDGVARFHHLYLEVTNAVDATAQAASFEDVDFLVALDVQFAGLYFTAVDASTAAQPVARAWAPLFQARDNRAIAPIQFALAGMNAHINHDLPLALVNTCRARGISISRDSPQFRDYTKVNGILAQVETQVKQEYLTGLVGIADSVVGRLDDVIAMWSVAEARDAAWTNAETLWALRDLPDLSTAFEGTLDGTVGLSSRGLLIPTLG